MRLDSVLYVILGIIFILFAVIYLVSSDIVDFIVGFVTCIMCFIIAYMLKRKEDDHSDKKVFPCYCGYSTCK